MPTEVGPDPTRTSPHNGLSNDPENVLGEIPRRRRLFRLAKAPASAVASPFPRPRDENGNTRSRSYSPDPPLPELGELLKEHTQSADLIGHYRPLRSHILRGMMGRVDATILRYRTIVDGEEQALRNYNDDAASARADVQAQIDGFSDARSKIKESHDSECTKRREDLATARANYAAERVRNGRPLPLIEWKKQNGIGELIASLPPSEELAPSGGLPADEPDASTTAPEAATPQTEEVAPQPDTAARTNHNVFMRMLNRTAELATTDGGVALSPVDINRFPIDHGRQQAKPPEVHAYESGYPDTSPAAHVARGNVVLNYLAMLTCGTIFGSSIGLLLGFIDPDAMVVAAQQTVVNWIVCSVFGVALFYILGVTAEAISALISEQYHGSLLASHRDDPAGVGKWLLRAAGWTFLVGSILFCLLIVIEAFIERYGIVQLGMTRLADMRITNHHLTLPGGISDTAAWFLAFVASVPYMCFHAVRGWTHSRSAVMHHAMVSLHVKEAWSIATAKHADTLEQFKKMLEESHIKATGEEEEEELDATLAQPILEAIAEVPQESDEDIKRRITLARANEDLRTAYIVLREAYSARRDAIRPFDLRIEQLERLLVSENVELTHEAKRRIEDGYADVQYAVKLFDTTLREEITIFEQLARGGIFVRIKNWLFRAAFADE